MIDLPPSLVLSLLIAAFYGALFHLVWGRTAVDLLRALAIAVIGFLAGEAGAYLIGFRALMLGDVHLGVASAVAWASLGINLWQSREPE